MLYRDYMIPVVVVTWGPMGLSSSYDWDYSPTYNWGVTPISPFRGIIIRVIIPPTSRY